MTSEQTIEQLAIQVEDSLDSLFTIDKMLTSILNDLFSMKVTLSMMRGESNVVEVRDFDRAGGEA